jgi:MOSC domain-containing protein YiiM
MATIQSIVYKPKGAKADHNTSGYLRVPVQEANLIEGHGIEGDRKGGNPKRNLNVMDEMTQAELEADGYPVGPGVLGENIILGGIELRTLVAGTCLRLGSDAIIQLGKPRIPCEQLTPLDERMPENVYERVGTMCRVIRSGHIKVGDPVSIIKEPVAEAVAELSE